MRDITRRQFVIAGGLGLSLWVPGVWAGPTSANTGNRRRRHFINIQGFGGWDSAWHHSPLLERDTEGLTPSQLKDNFLGVYDTPRFPDDKALAFGGRNDQRVGIGLSAYTPRDQNDILIWRGINSVASHDVGNRYTQCGSLSGYAASYSVLIAKALAMSPDYLRPLHYVQTTRTSADFRSQVGFITGAGVPINLPGAADWVQLSATDPNDPINSPALTGRFVTLFDRLLVPSGMKPASERKITESFASAYGAAESVRNKNYGTSRKFLDTVESYKKAIIADVGYVMFSAPGGGFVREGLKDFGTQLPTSESGVGAFLAAIFGSSLDEIVYPIAVAEFLVTEDLSAVVDCTVRLGDYHNDNHWDLLQVLVATSAVRKLLGSLRSTPLASSSSESLLDVTTVVMGTEFDRTINRYPQDPAGLPGTNHGATMSMMLAGYGVSGGKIIGGRGTAPGGAFGGLATANVFNSPLPIDLNSGLPSASGTLVDNGAIQPTILRIFGVTQPSQQFIGAPVVNAVIKPGHMG